LGWMVQDLVIINWSWHGRLLLSSFHLL